MSERFPPDEELDTPVPPEMCHDGIPNFTVLSSDKWNDEYLDALVEELDRYTKLLTIQRQKVLDCEECDINYNSHQLIQTQYTHLAVEIEIRSVRRKLHPDEKR